MLHGGMSHELVLENYLSKPILVEQKTTQVSTLCSNNNQHGHLSTFAINKSGNIESRQKLT